MEEPKEEPTLTLPSGVTVTLHYEKDGPSLEDCIISILRSHMSDP